MTVIGATVTVIGVTTTAATAMGAVAAGGSRPHHGPPDTNTGS